MQQSSNKTIRILAIETSCDETAAAVIGEAEGRPVILSNIVSSQIDLHAKTGGVVPEVASREHMKSIIPIVSEALEKSVADEFLISNSKFLNDYQGAIKLLDSITHIAVTTGPGLIGSLLVGVNAAKTLAYARDLPIIPINHIEGHIYSALDSQEQGVGSREKIRQTPNAKRQTVFPILALTVSGGHTSLTLMKDHGEYQTIGSTIDDAVGEAYDKVAKLLGLGYPGGPAISKLAQQFRDKFLISNFKFLNKSQIPSPKSQVLDQIVFPRPIINDGTFNFSLSGLKTAVLIWVKKYLEANNLNSADEIPEEIKEEIAAAFEESVKDVLVKKTLAAANKFKPVSVIFAGGVSANAYLVDKIRSGVRSHELEENTPCSKLQTPAFFVPDKKMTGDNAAMIGLAAYYHIDRDDMGSWEKIKPDSNLEL